MFSSIWVRWTTAASLLVVGALVLASTISRHNDVPESYAIELPDFHGRVLPLEKIKPGTFTITEDFESVSQWGQEGILVYEGKLQKVSLKAWRPDPKTAGVFQYAEREFSVSEHWASYHRIEKVEKENGALRVYSRVALEPLLPGYLAALVLLFVGLCLTPAGAMLKKLINP